VAHSSGGANGFAGTPCSAPRSKITVIALSSFAASIPDVLAMTTTSNRSLTRVLRRPPA
jgi:hypothetical protein